MGDLKYGPTVHALSLALSHYKVRQIFISHSSLAMPDEFLEILRKAIASRPQTIAETK
jgi:aspartate carbamoyltransferase catalytic subunit